jgi:hypothetical protein
MAFGGFDPIAIDAEMSEGLWHTYENYGRVQL